MRTPTGHLQRIFCHPERDRAPTPSTPGVLVQALAIAQYLVRTQSLDREIDEAVHLRRSVPPLAVDDMTGRCQGR